VLPSLEKAFTDLPAHQRAQVIAHRPNAYFAGHLAALMADAVTFDQGQYLARTAVLACAGHLTLDQHQELLTAWRSNSQCWGRAMPYHLHRSHATRRHTR
jgi:hypothetical protein